MIAVMIAIGAGENDDAEFHKSILTAKLHKILPLINADIFAMHNAVKSYRLMLRGA